MDGNRNTEVAKFVYKARSKTLDIKTQKAGNIKISYVSVAVLIVKREMKY